MKKVLALLLAVSMLVMLAACGKDQGDSSATEQPSEFTSGTPTETDPTTPEEEPHSHSYSQQVTTEATCAAEGEKTFTCDCGDSYTESIPMTDHTWGEWVMDAPALVGKVGREKMTCSVCFATEFRERTANAVTNSFYDGGLQYILASHYGQISAATLLSYFCHEFPEYWNQPTSSETLFAVLAERFELTEELKADIIQFGKEMPFYQYDPVADTFVFQDNGEVGTNVLLGYTHVEGNRYIAYYNFSPVGIDATVSFAIELEYNRAEGKPNKYFSAGRAGALPENMIACAEGEIYELVW